MCKIGSRSRKNRRRAPSSNSVRAVCSIYIRVAVNIIALCVVDCFFFLSTWYLLCRRKKRPTLSAPCRTPTTTNGTRVTRIAAEAKATSRATTANTTRHTRAARARARPRRHGQQRVVARRSSSSLNRRLSTLSARHTTYIEWCCGLTKTVFGKTNTTQLICAFCEIYLVFFSFFSSATSLSDARKYLLTLLLFVSLDM